MERGQCYRAGFDGCIILRLICGERGVYMDLVGKPEGNRPLGRPSRRWIYIIIMDLWKDWGVYVLGGETGGKETSEET